MKYMATQINVDGEESISATCLPAGWRNRSAHREFMHVCIADYLSLVGDPDPVVNVLRKAADLAAEKLAEVRTREAVAS